jgi:hypothetical protein
MPLFGHSHEEPDGDSGASAAKPVAVDTDGVLAHLMELPLPQRASEIMPGIASQIPDGAHAEMDRLQGAWLPDQNRDVDHPDSWWTLRSLLPEIFQALELSRLIVRIDEDDNQGGTTNYYKISSDGQAALGRGDVAEIVARRLPD